MKIDSAHEREHEHDDDRERESAAPTARYEPVNGLERCAIASAAGLGAVSVRLRSVMERRPTATRVLVAVLVMCGAFALAGRGAKAQLLQMPIDDAFHLGKLGEGALFDGAFALAQEIFVTLAVLSVIVNVVAYYIRQQTVQGLGQVVLSSVLRLGIPFLIIQGAAQFVPTIAETGLQIASNLAGKPPAAIGRKSDTPTDSATLENEINTTYLSVFNAPSNRYGVSTKLTPGNIATLGASTAWDFMQTLYGKVQASHRLQGQNPNSNNGFDPITQGAEQNVLNLMIILSMSVAGIYTFIAVELVIAYLQIYLALPLGAWMLGFLGAPATSRLGQGYWTMAAQALLRFVVIVFVIGFAVAVASGMSNYAYDVIHNTGTLSLNPTNGIFSASDLNILKELISFTFGSASILYIVRVLPNMIMSVLVGAVVGAEGNPAEGQISGALQGYGGRSGALGRTGRGGNPLGTNGKVPTPRYTGR